MLQADSQSADAAPIRTGEAAIVDIHHVSRSYGSVRALRDVNLTLAPGTIGLVGNNGAGKSTLLKVLLGLLAPDEGGGTILGCDIRHGSPELRGRVGYMPEAAAIVPMLKGVEFVTFAGDLYGMPHRDARRRAHEVLNYVGLGELRYRRLEEYSTGNLQRLKLAAALVHDPQLLLLDEPTNGLDPAGRIAMLELLEDLIRRNRQERLSVHASAGGRRAAVPTDRRARPRHRRALGHDGRHALANQQSLPRKLVGPERRVSCGAIRRGRRMGRSRRRRPIESDDRRPLGLHDDLAVRAGPSDRAPC